MSPVRFDLDLQGLVMYLLMNLPASTMPHLWLMGARQVKDPCFYFDPFGLLHFLNEL